MRETGRFAPSPTGPLHAGSLVAALASWLDVRARGPQARWLIRIEDADTERCLPGMGEHMLRQLADCHLLPDETPVWQKQRTAHYEAALQKLQARGLAYPCGCSRKDIDIALARRETPHPAPLLPHSNISKFKSITLPDFLTYSEEVKKELEGADLVIW